jgi:hypothetical protein
MIEIPHPLDSSCTTNQGCFTPYVCYNQTCSPNCLNNATYELVNNNTYRCNCQPGYTGQNCSEIINNCLHNQCNSNHTTNCTNIIGNGTYSCNCNPGYEGTYCNIDPCNAKGTNGTEKCNFHGSCLVTNSTYQCNCQAGYNGTHCEDIINNCYPQPCMNHASCSNLINDYNCSCAAPWINKNCSISNYNCTALKPCQNNGICTVDSFNTNGFNCSCSSPWIGTSCSISNYSCSSLQPCQNGGLCKIDSTNPTGYNCTCFNGWSGSICTNSTGVDIALNKPASSITNVGGCPPSAAVDGNIGSILETTSIDRPWWFVDLLNDYIITQTTVYGRTDCCWDRLDDFHLRIGSYGTFANFYFNPLVYVKLLGTPQVTNLLPEKVPANPTTQVIGIGRYVWINRDLVNTIIDIGEVDIRGVNCPTLGYYFDTTLRTCLSCPINTTTTTRAALSCTICKNGYSGFNCTNIESNCLTSPCPNGFCQNNGSSFMCSNCLSGWSGLYCNASYTPIPTNIAYGKPAIGGSVPAWSVDGDVNLFTEIIATTAIWSVDLLDDYIITNSTIYGRVSFNRATNMQIWLGSNSTTYNGVQNSLVYTTRASPTIDVNNPEYVVNLITGIIGTGRYAYLVRSAIIDLNEIIMYGVQCPLGYYYTNSTKQCLPCPSGTYLTTVKNALSCNTCPLGWTGYNCTVYSCSLGQPCQNGASCTVDYTKSIGYNCTCVGNYTGTNCDIPQTTDFSSGTGFAPVQLHMLSSVTTVVNYTSINAYNASSNSPHYKLQPSEYYSLYLANNKNPPVLNSETVINELLMIRVKFDHPVYLHGLMINDSSFWDNSLFVPENVGCQIDLGYNAISSYDGVNPIHNPITTPTMQANVSVNTTDFFDYARAYFYGKDMGGGTIKIKTPSKYCPAIDPYPRYPIWRSYNKSTFAAWQIEYTTIDNTVKTFRNHIAPSHDVSYGSTAYPTEHYIPTFPKISSLPYYSFLLPVSATIPTNTMLKLAERMLPLPTDLSATEFILVKLLRAIDTITGQSTAILDSSVTKRKQIKVKFKTPTSQNRIESCGAPNHDQGEYWDGLIIPAMTGMNNDTNDFYLPTPDFRSGQAPPAASDDFEQTYIDDIWINNHFPDYIDSFHDPPCDGTGILRISGGDCGYERDLFAYPADPIGQSPTGGLFTGSYQPGPWPVYPKLNPCDRYRGAVIVSQNGFNNYWTNFDAYPPCLPSGAATPEFDGLLTIGWCIKQSEVNTNKWSLTDVIGNPIQLEYYAIPPST